MLGKGVNFFAYMKLVFDTVAEVGVNPLENLILMSVSSYNCKIYWEQIVYKFVYTNEILNGVLNKVF